jgi:ParB/RepB/Spo0J family partition protein
MSTTQAPAQLGFQEIPLDRLTPHPTNPRGAIAKADVQELADSIAAQGVVTPLLVRPLGAGYQVLAGHRRQVAAKLAGLKAVPVIVRPMDDRQALKVMLTENAGRADLNPLQQAEAYARYLKETGETQEQLAASLGLTQGTVSSALALLALPPAARELVASGALTGAHGRELGRLANHPKALTSVLGWVKSHAGHGDAPSSRVVRSWVDNELYQLELERKEREAAERAKQQAAKDKAAGTKPAAVKLSPAAKEAARQALERRISRERHVEIGVRATAIAKEAVALGKRWTVPAGVLMAAAQACDTDRLPPSAAWGASSLGYDSLRTLQVALWGRLPGNGAGTARRTRRSARAMRSTRRPRGPGWACTPGW